MASSASPDPNKHYYVQLNGQSSDCMVAHPGLIAPTDYPIRVESCATAGDSALWRFASNGDGRDFVYNKAFGETSQRLDFVQPPGFPFVLIMGPSNDTYNNQRWELNWPSPNVVQFSSYGLPGTWLSSTEVNKGFRGVVLQDAGDDASSDSSWALVVADESSSKTTTSAPAPDAPSSVPGTQGRSSPTGLVIPTTTLPSSRGSPSDGSTPAGGQAGPSFTSIITTGTAGASSTKLATPLSDPRGPSASNTSSNIGPIIGGVVGGAVGLFLVALLIWCLMRRRRQGAKRQEKANKQSAGEARARLSTMGLLPSNFQKGTPPIGFWKRDGKRVVSIGPVAPSPGGIAS